MRTGLIAVMLVASPNAFCQGANGFLPVSSAGSNSATSQQLLVQVTGRVLGKLDDPSTGCHWILLANVAHPEGPGRVVLVGRPVAGREAATGRSASPTKGFVRDTAPLAAIHAGDTVVVEEHTPVVEARLAALALGSAEPGGEFRARLKIGGKVVRVRAIDSSSAALVIGKEVEP